MNNILFNINTPNDVAKQIAARVKTRRLELNLTQEGMSAKAGVEEMKNKVDSFKK